MITFLLWWFGIGFGSCFLAGMYLNREGLKFSEFLMILIASIVLGTFGPILTGWIVYWFWDGWRSKFAVDDEGRILYPWRDK